MKTDEKSQGAPVNNFYGNINNYNVYHGPLNYYGPVNHYYEHEVMGNREMRKATSSEVAAAVRKCNSMGLMWGPAAMGVIFGICRDEYHWQDNASLFERQMNVEQLNCPLGTISNTMRNNPYMKLHHSKWAEMGAKAKVLKLMETFLNEMMSQQTSKTT